MLAIRSLATSIFVLFGAVRALEEHRPLRILLNNGDDSGMHGCTTEDVQLIKGALMTSESKEDERRLQFAPFDDPCEDRCHGWPPGYCFWYFCSWVNHRQLRMDNKDQEQPLQQCADDLVVVNNVLNAVLPLVSESCQAILMENRAYQCN